MSKLISLFFILIIASPVKAQNQTVYYDLVPPIVKTDIEIHSIKDSLLYNKKKYVFTLNPDSTSILVTVFNNLNLCIEKGEYRIYSIDTIRSLTINISSGDVSPIPTGLRKKYLRENIWYILDKGKLKISYYRKGKKQI